MSSTMHLKRTDLKRTEQQHTDQQSSARAHHRGRRAIVAVLAAFTMMGLAAAPLAADVTTIGNSGSVRDITVGVDYNYELDAPVLRLYQAFFNREPDLEGAKYWLGIRRQGFNALQIAEFMSDSVEFANTYADTDNATFTELVYTNVLGRDFDQIGYDYWLGLLDSGPDDGGLDRPGMVFYVTDNDEFRNNFAFGTPAVGGVTFGDGVFEIGDGEGQVRPFEVYISIDPQANCQWQLRDSLDENAVDVVAATYTEQQPQVIIQVVDQAFVTSQNCGTFVPLNTVDLAPLDTLTTGTIFLTGTQVAPGFYRALPGGADCGWNRLNSFAVGDGFVTGGLYLPTAEQVLMQVTEGDAGLELFGGCGDWTRFENTVEGLEATFNQVDSFGDGIWLVDYQLPLGATFRTEGVPDKICEFWLLSDLGGEQGSEVEYQPGEVPGEPREFQVGGADYDAVHFQNCGSWTIVQ